MHFHLYRTLCIHFSLSLYYYIIRWKETVDIIRVYSPNISQVRIPTMYIRYIILVYTHRRPRMARQTQSGWRTDGNHGTYPSCGFPPVRLLRPGRWLEGSTSYAQRFNTLVKFLSFHPFSLFSGVTHFTTIPTNLFSDRFATIYGHDQFPAETIPFHFPPQK